MKNVFYFLTALLISVTFTGCPSPNQPEPDNNAGFKGFIYYSSGKDIYRLQLSNQTTTTLFTDAVSPEITSKGEILCVEPNFGRNGRIIYTDLAGANRKSLIETDGLYGTHKQFMNNPRLSYNQLYVVYYGNKHSFVIDAENGALLAKLGDWDSKNPMLSPSWAPDGSIFCSGEVSQNNGIYKYAPDFSTYVRIDPNLSNVTEPSVSPDGKKIAFIKDEKLWTMDIDGSNPMLLNTTTTNLRKPIWSPDSKYIAVVASLSGHIHIIDSNLLTDTKITKSQIADPDNNMSWRY